jgi:hypothetical protein
MKVPFIWAIALAPVLGCGLILGLEDKLPPAADESRPLEDASVDRRKEDVLRPEPTSDGAAENAASDVVDATVDADAAPTIDCLGVQRNAFFCDGFEGTTLDTQWQQIVLPSAPPADLGTTTLRKISGARSFYSGFSTLPNGGTARIRWARPGSGPLSLQLTFFFFDDAWGASDVVPLASIRVGGANAATLIWKHTTNANGNVEIHVDGQADVTLGPMKVNDWTCFEIYAEGTNVRSWAGATEKFPSLPLAGMADGAELGFQWLYGPDAVNSKYLGVDDVVLAPAPIGCLH